MFRQTLAALAVLASVFLASSARELLEKAQIGPNSGNGRLARQMLEDCIMEQAVRLQKRAANGFKPTIHELETLCPTDIVLNVEHLGLPPRIGFRAA